MDFRLPEVGELPSILQSSITPPPRVAPPAVLGNTTVPVQQLSYRWVINNADALLRGLEEDSSLKSSEFTITLPLRPKQQCTSWHLQLCKKRTGYQAPKTPQTLFLCHGSLKSIPRF